MRKFKLSYLIFILSLSIFAQQNDWENPKVNQINRLPATATFYNFDNEAQAISG